VIFSKSLKNRETGIVDAVNNYQLPFESLSNSSAGDESEIIPPTSSLEENEGSQYFEGDIILTEEQKRLVKENTIDNLNHDEVFSVGENFNRRIFENGLDDGEITRRWRKENFNPWPKNTLRYEIASSVTEDNRKKVKDTLRGLEEKLGGCITFRETSSRNRVLVKQPNDDKKCDSFIGYKGWRRQSLNLGNNCYRTGTVEHEFLHALGVWHQQSRSDRHNYVEVIKDNIENYKKRKGNFESYAKVVFNYFDLPYDFNSVMHYGEAFFGKRNANGQRLRTIETLDKKKQSLIGQRSGVSDLDIKLVKLMYNCQAPVGVVSSTNFPNNYPNKLKQTEPITAGKGQVLRLEFMAFDVEEHTRCGYDHLKIIDGDGTILMKKTCGNTLPPVLISKTNKVNLVFETDSTKTMSGWRVKWSAITPKKRRPRKRDK